MSDSIEAQIMAQLSERAKGAAIRSVYVGEAQWRELSKALGKHGERLCLSGVPIFRVDEEYHIGVGL